ncbi:MAG: hypothetical protein V4772_02170 [Pseudomonadota bacterium]
MFTALKIHAWAYPALEVGHLLGISLLIGNLVLLELRVFGLGSSLPVIGLARLSLGLAGTGFTLAAATGLLMFATQPAELLSNRAFTLKMLLLVSAACNAAWFHGRNSLVRLDAVARLQMLVSSIIWIAVVACGRWIAYI